MMNRYWKAAAVFCLMGAIVPRAEVMAAGSTTGSGSSSTSNSSNGASHGHGHGHPAPGGMEIRATCAPHQTRIVRQKVAASSPEFAGRTAQMRGCLAGSAIAFISHKGEVFPCGYLPVPAGDLRKQNFWEVWENSEVFKTISDPDALKGKCGVCEYRVICAGCRARAFGTSGDYMGQEPYCLYEPKAKAKK